MWCYCHSVYYSQLRDNVLLDWTQIQVVSSVMERSHILFSSGILVSGGLLHTKKLSGWYKWYKQWRSLSHWLQFLNSISPFTSVFQCFVSFLLSSSFSFLLLSLFYAKMTLIFSLPYLLCFQIPNCVFIVLSVCANLILMVYFLFSRCYLCLLLIWVKLWVLNYYACVYLGQELSIC